MVDEFNVLGRTNLVMETASYVVSQDISLQNVIIVNKYDLAEAALPTIAELEVGIQEGEGFVRTSPSNLVLR